MQLELTYQASPAPEAIPKAPALKPHAWPYPGLSGDECVRSALAQSPEFIEVIALTIKALGADAVTDAQVKAALPADWLSALGRWAHASLSAWQGERHGILVEYVSHGLEGGYHWQYSITGQDQDIKRH